MRTLLPDPPPPEFEQLLERRRRWGADTRDEVWQGVLHDETWHKLPFYCERHVDEVLIVDPEDCAVHWFSLSEGEYREVDRSALVELDAGELRQRLGWPASR